MDDIEWSGSKRVDSVLCGVFTTSYHNSVGHSLAIIPHQWMKLKVLEVGLTSLQKVTQVESCNISY